MTIAKLITLLSIRDTGSFQGASDALRLSHSAVSVQMRQLEQQLGHDLFHKGRRPARLTAFGQKTCVTAAPIVADYNRLMRADVDDSTAGEVRIGFVSTTFQTVLPIVLEQLQTRFSQLDVRAVSGMSDELAAQIDNEDLDFAFISAPSQTAGNIRLIQIAKEPLHVIAPFGMAVPDDPLMLLQDKPFIGFARHTWLGAQIDASLREIGVFVRQVTELDSIDAIEALVAKGMGVSIVPQRLFAAPLANKVQCLDFPVRNNQRVLSLIYHRKNTRNTVLQALAEICS